jgi:hypothetical protein
VAGAGALRVGLAPGWRATVSAGVRSGDAGIGVGVGVTGVTALRQAGRDRSLSANEALVDLWAAPVPGRLGAQLGAEVRRFREGDTVVHTGAMPFARLVAGLGLHLGRRLWLEPQLAYRRDLGATELRVDGVPVQELPIGSLEAAITLGYR